MIQFDANKLRLLRQSRNMQQKDVAPRTNISKQRYSELENKEDRPDNRTLEILKALEYTEETAKKFLESIPPPPAKKVK